jgi:hydroxymethylglutaryl-CoA reductase
VPEITRAKPHEAFAEVCTATILAGEISIVGALASDEFAKAHQHRARGKRSPRARS